ncbi:MAG: hypothetical protein ACTSQI_08610 [Candidatus Helarchaeota archaeon]
MQGDLSDPVTWLWIIIFFLIAWLFFFLSLWIVEGKLHAKRKLGGTAIAAFVAVLIIPYLQSVGGIHQVLSGLGPFIAYFIVILLLKGLATEQWSNAVIVGFIGILFLLIISNLLIMAGVTVGWPLFVTS